MAQEDGQSFKDVMRSPVEKSKRRHSGAKHKALKARTKSYSGHYQEGSNGRIRQLSSKEATRKNMDAH